MSDEAQMMPSELVGHQAQITAVETSFESGKMHHAWLLTGPKGIGKSVFAKQLAAAIIAHDDGQSALFGDKTPFSMAYESGNQTMRQVLQSAHPDFLSIAPIDEDKNKSGTIKVEQIRELTPFFSHKSANGGWRVAMIDTLDIVNQQGANAMLKIIEEPPEKAVILLLARSVGSVLPTIRSRCRELRFDPLLQTEQLTLLSKFLPDADNESLRKLAVFSGGSIGYALEIAQTDALDLYEATCLILSKSQTDTNALLELSGKWGAATKKNLRPIAVQGFSRLLSSAALQAAGHPSPVALLASEKLLIDQLCEGHDAKTLADLHDEFYQTVTSAERAYLDMVSIFLSIFDKIHRFAHEI